MKAVLQLLPLLLFASCSLLKKESSLLKQQGTEKTTTALHQRLTKETLDLINDSSYSEVEVEFYPKGKFTYVVAKGFEGEGGMVKIKQKGGRLHQEQLTAKLDQQTSVSSEQVKAEKSMVRSKQAQRLGHHWLLWFLMLLLVALTWFFRRRIFSWFGF